jgi:hypothetical protein
MNIVFAVNKFMGVPPARTVADQEKTRAAKHFTQGSGEKPLTDHPGIKPNRGEITCRVDPCVPVGGQSNPCQRLSFWYDNDTCVA